MALHKFPMDSQSCPLMFGSYAYTKEELIYRWTHPIAVTFAKDMALSQFDLINSPQRNTSVVFRTGEFSVLQVNFNLKRHTGYFLIQVYVPCVLIVVLSWVSFWINREATSDRVGLGITTVLTLSTFGLDSRTDLPKVHYATAIDWFIVMCFIFVIATLLEFAGVHYFTKIGSGEIFPDSDDEWEDVEVEELDQECESPPLPTTPAPIKRCNHPLYTRVLQVEAPVHAFGSPLRLRDDRPLYLPTKTVFTQTDARPSCCRQFLYCLLANEDFRLRRQPKIFDPDVTNSVSKIDRVSRVIFPLVFILLNCLYWLLYSQQSVEADWMQAAAAAAAKSNAG